MFYLSVQSALSMGSHIDVTVSMIYWQLSHVRAILPINISIFIVSETSAPVHWPNSPGCVDCKHVYLRLHAVLVHLSALAFGIIAMIHAQLECEADEKTLKLLLKG